MAVPPLQAELAALREEIAGLVAKAGEREAYIASLQDLIAALRAQVDARVVAV